MRCFLAICLLGLSMPGWAQSTARQHTPQTKTTPALKTFSSPDGAFQFQYPDLLIPCERRPQGTGDGYYWPQAECSGYGGVCDDEGDPNYAVVVCYAYPRNKFTDTPMFEAAAFSVGLIVPVPPEKDCLVGSSDGSVQGVEKPTTIGGVQFNVFHTGDAGMSQSIDSKIYRTFHGGKCYQLAIAEAFASPGSFDPPVRSLSEHDGNEVNRRLGQARDSFKFLK